MLRFYAALAVALLFTAKLAAAQASSQTEKQLFVICEVQHADLGAALPVKAVGGVTGAPFGITYLIVADTSGRQLTLVYGLPVAVRTGSLQLITVEWLPRGTMSFVELMNRTLGKKWLGDVRIEYQQTATADGLILTPAFSRTAESPLADKMRKYCDK